MKRESRLIELGVAILFVALTVGMTWPLARSFRHVVADPTDPYINSWILDWDYYATFVSPRPLFDADIFVPAKHALAFSENLYGLALLSIPFRLAGTRPLTTHNLLFLLGFAACGYAAYLLGRHATHSRAAGIVSGVVYAFVPWRFTHFTHLQYAWTATLPLFFLALLRYADKPTLARAATVTLAVLAVGSTNLHAFAFGTVAAAIVTLILIARQPLMRNTRAILTLGAAIAIGCIVLLPILLPYRAAQREYHMRGDVRETMSYSAEPADWLLSNFHSRFYLPLRTNDPAVNAERWLFPGLGGLILAIIALFAAFPAASRVRVLLEAMTIALLVLLFLTHTSRAAVAVALLLFLFGRLAMGRMRMTTTVAIGMTCIVIGFVGSLGLHTPFHTFLFENLSLFRGIRVPARWAMIAHVGIAMMAAAGCAALLEHRSRRSRGIAATAIVAVLLIELHAAPIAYQLSPRQTPAVYHWLADVRPHAILELPIEEENSEYTYMLYSTVHHIPMVNGVSGFMPPQFDRIAREFRNETPSPALLPELRAAGVDTIVIHFGALKSQKAAVGRFVKREVSAGRLTFVGGFDNAGQPDFVLQLQPRSARALAQTVVAYGGVTDPGILNLLPSE